MGKKGGCADGLETDPQNRIYCTNYEHNGILRRCTDGYHETVVHDPRVLRPDTMSVATDSYLYFTNNQLHNQKTYHWGMDLRRKPYTLMRVWTGAHPVLLRK